MSSGVAYGVLRDAEELAAFAPAWGNLWRRDQSCTPFQSPEWLIPWWHAFGNGELRALTIRQDGVLIGFAPFYLYCGDGKTDRRLLMLGVGTTDYLDGVFSPACQTKHIRSALNLLCESEDWDILDVSQLRQGSKLLEAARSSAASYGVFQTEHCSRMNAARIADLPQKIRRNVMYYRNRAARSGALELRTSDAADCINSFDLLTRLHTDRWRQRGGAGVLADARVQVWHREALPLLARNGILRFSTLWLNREPIGIIYSLVDPADHPDRCQYFYLTGYSTKHSDLRPGTLSIAMTTESAFEDEVKMIDMLRGEEEYKRLWHLKRYPTYGFSFRRSTKSKVGEDDMAA